MLKWNREKFKGFLIGACTVGLLASVSTAFADGKLTTINVVQGGIKLFVDGKLVKPTDSDGKVVEPFIYDGTTYLPLRALSNALTNNQKSVSWDGDTSSIYVGQAPVAAQVDIGELKTYNANDSGVRKADRAIFKTLDKTFTPFNRLSEGDVFIYMLHSDYSQVNGQLLVPYVSLGSAAKGGVSFYNVDKKGKETLIKSFETGAGDDPVNVNVDVRGVEILKIRVYPHEKLGYSDGTFYNVTLSGVQ